VAVTDSAGTCRRCRGLEVQQRASQEAMRSMEGRIRALERRASAEFLPQH
jgi:hypothetical protein